MAGFDLSGRVALITGASRGIGKAVAYSLSDAGADVMLIARGDTALKAIEKDIRMAGRRCVVLPCDLRDPKSCDLAQALVQETFERLDILVGNAAILGSRDSVEQVTEDAWNDVFELDFHANIRLIRRFHRMLAESDSGRVIAVTSRGARLPAPFAGPYCAAKAALEAAMLCYAGEHAETAMRVNVIDPGPSRTDMRAEFMPDEDPQEIPEPTAVAELFQYLASPECWQNGEVIRFLEWQSPRDPGSRVG